METNFFAVRFLTKNPGALKVHPTKIIVPPQKKVSVKIIMGLNKIPSNQRENIILAEYFIIGENLLTLSRKEYWKSPFVAPQKQWKFKFLQVYYENEEIIESNNNNYEKTEENSQ